MMPQARVLAFGELDGWAAADHAAALHVYARSIPAGWPVPDGTPARVFFESAFVPVLPDPRPGLMTGYYEPVIDGAQAADAHFAHPLCRMPADAPPDHPWYSRAEIARRGLTAGLEIVWVESALEAFLAQVQGSVSVRLPDGHLLRLGFAGRNGHPYHSIGAELVARGAVAADAISVAAIRAWCASHPEQVQGLLDTNPSYIFFRVLDLPPDAGPVGAAGVPLTPMVSLAADPDIVPQGAPVWVRTDGPEAMRRLMVAQDRGAAIKGPGRGDMFFGTGALAGERAGRMREPARMATLLPRGVAQGIAT